MPLQYQKMTTFQEAVFNLGIAVHFNKTAQKKTEELVQAARAKELEKAKAARVEELKAAAAAAAQEQVEAEQAEAEQGDKED